MRHIREKKDSGTSNVLSEWWPYTKLNSQGAQCESTKAWSLCDWNPTLEDKGCGFQMAKHSEDSFWIQWNISGFNTHCEFIMQLLHALDIYSKVARKKPSKHQSSIERKIAVLTDDDNSWELSHMIHMGVKQTKNISCDLIPGSTWCALDRYVTDRRNSRVAWTLLREALDTWMLLCDHMSCCT